jgi:hypothetical protein
VTTAEILVVFVLCLSTSLGIAYVFLRMVVTLTTRANNDYEPAGFVSRRSLAAWRLRANHDLGR